MNIINDFSISINTINGSGSGTANLTILKSIFRMGVPVSGKNILPSNIQGMPTEYIIRINKDGYVGRKEFNDIIIDMNSKQINDHINGSVLICRDDATVDKIHNDIFLYQIPVEKLITESGEYTKSIKIYLENMTYVGFLAFLVGIDLDEIYNVLLHHFENKKDITETNFTVVNNTYEWAKINIRKNDPYIIQRINNDNKKILTDGNLAAALGSIYGGVQFAAWYPITPASSISENLHEYLPVLRKDPVTGKDTYAVVQAEDEIAAIGMSIGAGWAGLRSMTATSGPGLSLMAEYIGLAYYAEIPVVIWNVQRVGPSTGLPTRTAQGDLLFSNSISHGDTEYIILIPGSLEECFDFGCEAFNYAEKYQTPVIILSDMDLGMNQWTGNKFLFPETKIDRGKIIWENDLQNILNQNELVWGRYLDIDFDNIPYRTVPGNQNPKSAYFARGTGHDEFGNYSEDPCNWEKLLNRLKNKVAQAKTDLPGPVSLINPEADIGIISMGSTNDPIYEAINQLESDGWNIDYLRIRSIPISDKVFEFINNHKINYVVELNRDGQLYKLLLLEFPNTSKKLESLTKIDGLPLSSEWIIRVMYENMDYRDNL